MILVGANNGKFGELEDDLSNIYQYPKTREGIVSLLENWKGPKKQQPTTTTTTTVQDKVTFVGSNKNGKRVNA